MTSLVCHPQTPCDAVRSIAVNVTRKAPGMLQVDYRVDGHLERVRVPSGHTPARAERLWQHTCCEIFVARPGLPAYHEFNFSPSGQWAAYAFSRYREPQAFEASDPRISVRHSTHRLELQACIPAEAGRLRLGLSVVIEDDAGALSYWSLRHPAGKPDFHHSEAFALEIE